MSVTACFYITVDQKWIHLQIILWNICGEETMQCGKQINNHTVDQQKNN